jgi:uncharacterized protein involved in exopolysaccharide biosynthesis
MTPHRDEVRKLFQRLGKHVRYSRRYWLVYLAALVLANVAAVTVPMVLEPVYVSQTVVASHDLVPMETLLGRDVPVETPRQRGARLKEMLMARANLEALMTELGLYGDVIASRGMAQAVDEFLEDAKCEVGDDTFAITFEYRDPELAQKTAARLADSLITQSTEYRRQVAKSTSEFLASQRDDMKVELDRKEQALAQFLARHPEFARDIMIPGGVAPAGASIRAHERATGSSSSAAEALERQRTRIMSRIRAIDDPGSSAAAVQLAAQDPLVARKLEGARAELERAQNDLRDAQSRFTSMHPDVKHANGRVQSALQALRSVEAAAQKVHTPAPITAPPAKESDRSDLDAQLRRVNQAIAQAQQAAAAPGDKTNDKASNWIVDLETEWTTLNRDVHDARERYQQIQRHYFQASIIDHSVSSEEGARMTVIDPAYFPERPARRGPRRTAAAAAIVVLLLGAMVALGLVYLDDPIYGVDDLKHLGLAGIAHGVPLAPRRGNHG